MLNYIKAELYRNFNRKYFWLYTGITAALLIGLNLLLYASNSGSSSYNLTTAAALSTHALIVPIFLILPMLDISVLEEYKNLTTKNVLSFGLSRSTYIISKFVVSLIFSLLMALIVLVAFFGSTAILFGIGNSSNLPFTTFLSIIAVSVPLWIAALAVGLFISIVVSNSTTASFVYAGIFLVFSSLIKLLYMFVWHNFIHIYNILITSQLKSFAIGLKNIQVNLNSVSIEKAIISSIIYIIIFIVLSIVVFDKKEIK